MQYQILVKEQTKITKHCFIIINIIDTTSLHFNRQLESFFKTKDKSLVFVQVLISLSL
jgi:hypothetical protein